MKYFSINEFVVSNTANRLGINNSPDDIHKINIMEFINELLDPLREAWGECCQQYNWGNPGIKVTSGYRSPALNKAVGGSNTSSHSIGYAADLVPSNGKLKEFKHFCMDWLKNKKFDQFISEDEHNGVPRWIHIGYKNSARAQRRQFMSMIDGKYYNI